MNICVVPHEPTLLGDNETLIERSKKCYDAAPTVTILRLLFQAWVNSGDTNLFKRVGRARECAQACLELAWLTTDEFEHV